MKTYKTIAYGLFAVIIALSLAGCPDPDPTHTHDYGTEWKSNETQHWHECSCGDKTDVADHTAGDWIVDQAAAATTDGSKHKECTVCGYETETETIPATGEGHVHDYSTEWKSNATQHWHECSCGEKTDVADHTAGDWIVDQAATATIDGSRHKECTDCGYETETETIPATGEGHTHDYSAEWSSNETQHWHECSCGDKTDAADHSGDPCDICGYTSGSQNPDICECNGIAEDCECEDCDCEVCEEEPPVNQPPMANAGTDKTVTLAGNLTITLSGTGADSDGNITAYAWECVSYTADKGAVSAAYSKAQVDALIANANTATATVAPRKAGTYVFKLTVTDNDGGSDTDAVTVVVEGYTAQKDVTVSFPAFVAGATLSFAPTYTPAIIGDGFVDGDVIYTVTDDKGNTWDSAIGYNVSVTLYTNPTTVTFTQFYKYKNGTVIASQNLMASTSSIGGGRFSSIRDINTNESIPAFPSLNLHLEKTITELPPVSAHAQAEPTHTLANDLTITLDGTDSTGNISAYAWECVSYTANQGAVSAEYTKAQVDALITNANTATATVAPRKAGTYVFRLTVTGDDGESDTDTVAVVVEPMTHTITVPAITTVANPLNFGAVSALTGWNSDFASTDVTYTLTLDNVDQPANTTSISAVGINNGAHTIIQTFYYKGNPVPNGSRSGTVGVMSNSFLALTQNFIELPLLLSKGELP